MDDSLFIIDPGNQATIPVLYAFLSIDENGEGLCSMFLDNKWWTMVSGKESVVKNMKIAAKALSAKTGKPIKLVKFTAREELETFGAN